MRVRDLKLLVPIAMYYVLPFHVLVCFAPLFEFLLIFAMCQTISRCLHTSDVNESIDIVCHNLNVLIVVMYLIYTAKVRINLHICKHLRE